MIAALIRWSVANRFLVLLATLFVTAWGIWSVQKMSEMKWSSLSFRRCLQQSSHPHFWLLKAQDSRPRS